MNEKEFNRLVQGYIRGFEMLNRNSEAFHIKEEKDLESIYSLGQKQFLINIEQLSPEEIEARRKAYDTAFQQFKNDQS
ncbi:hypothetical protein LC040_00045 [Bacillus tianshenii]|nr:hypothetical protein LC040_00045 [Bacillus tianshenii]